MAWTFGILASGTVAVSEPHATHEVTREVPVTRIAAATPAPAVAPTVSPADTPTATPSPTAAPTVAPTPTPTPPATTQFGSWAMEELEHYGTREIRKFLNMAIVQQTILTYQCDTHGGRTMYIDWRHHITAESADRPSASRDPFSQYRDIPFYALLEYADGLLDFVDDLRLIPGEQTDLGDIWDKVEDRWFIGQGASHLGGDPTPAHWSTCSATARTAAYRLTWTSVRNSLTPIGRGIRTAVAGHHLRHLDRAIRPHSDQRGLHWRIAAIDTRPVLGPVR